MESLLLVDRWPVGKVAAGTLTAAGAVASHGPAGEAFPWASVTKLVTAMSVLVAVEEGVVDLDQPVVEWDATVGHVLAHASGLAPDPPPARLAPPATRRIYSNAGFQLLGDVVAGAAGIGFPQYLREAVLEPLGMGGTRLEGSPAAGLVGTLEDLLRLAAELLAPTLVAQATLAEAISPAFGELPGVLPGFGYQHDNAWGLGFEIRAAKRPHWTAPHGSPRTFGHFGRSGAFLWVDPDAGAACAVLTDREFGEWARELWPVFSGTVLAELAGLPWSR